jgi:hypothetical protein
MVDTQKPVLPPRNHAIVLVSQLNQPTMRAVAYATATRPSTLEALTVQIDETETAKLLQQWTAHDLDIPLVILESPFREISQPVISYIRSRRRDSPRDVVTVFLPEYVVGRWWEHLLHNQSALRIKTRLLFEPGVMVTSVPWQLRSSSRREPPPGSDRSLPARGADRAPAAPADALSAAEPVSARTV